VNEELETLIKSVNPVEREFLTEDLELEEGENKRKQELVEETGEKKEKNKHLVVKTGILKKERNNPRKGLRKSKRFQLKRTQFRKKKKDLHEKKKKKKPS